MNATKAMAAMPSAAPDTVGNPSAAVKWVDASVKKQKIDINKVALWYFLGAELLALAISLVLMVYYAFQ